MLAIEAGLIKAAVMTEEQPTNTVPAASVETSQAPAQPMVDVKNPAETIPPPPLPPMNRALQEQALIWLRQSQVEAQQ